MIGRAEKFFIYIGLAIVMLGTLVFAYTVFIPVHVLEQWTIATTASSYTAGDKLTYNSYYNKVINATGDVTRKLQCLDAKNQWRDYFTTTAKGNKGVGSGQSSVTITIPATLSDKEYRCRIYVSATYDVYRYRPVTQEQVSNIFTVHPPAVSVTTPQQQNDAPSNLSSSTSGSTQTSNTTVEPTPVPTDIESSSGTPTPTPTPQGPVQGVLQFVNNLISNILH